MRDSLSAKAVIGLQDNILVMLLEKVFKIGESITPFGKRKVVIERIKHGVVDGRKIGGAQDLKGREFIGGDIGGRLRIESKVIIKNVAYLAGLLKTKKPTARKNLQFYILLPTNLDEDFMEHVFIITDSARLKRLFFVAIFGEVFFDERAQRMKREEIFVSLIEAEAGKRESGDGEQDGEHGAENRNLARGAG